MAIYHINVTPVTRSKGRTATAAAAYRNAEKIVDERTGEVHDYTRKGGVLHSEIITPDNTSVSRADLWNRAEASEKRKDARIAREYEISLPAELDATQRADLARDFARHLASRYGVAVDMALHKPHRKGDDRNFHAHILTTTRQFHSGQLGDKAVCEWEDKRLKAEGLPTGKKQMEEIRAALANIMNQHLERAGLAERVDHRTLAAQGITDRKPQVHLGPTATAMERRGVQTNRGDLNRSDSEDLTAMQTELETLKGITTGANMARQKALAFVATRAKEQAAREQAERDAAVERMEAEHQAKKQAEARARAEAEARAAEERKNPKRERDHGPRHGGGMSR